MPREAEPLDYLIIAAKAGNPEALDLLSKKAFGGHRQAQIAIDEIDKTNWQPRSTAEPQSIVWPKRQRGPKRGDIPQHLNI